MAKYDWNVKNVMAMTEAKQERAFKRVGAYIRSDARHSIRVSIRNSMPGQPPLAKRRTFKNTIMFAADKSGVVTGPIYAHPANATPHVLEAGGWRQDTIGRIRARWERANPEKARQLRREEKAAIRARQKETGSRKFDPTRVRSERELEHIRDYYAKLGQKTALAKKESDKIVRFRIERRPYMQPAFEKNKQKTLALLAGR